MKIIDTNIENVKIIEPTVFEDSRGYFFESFNEEKLSQHLSLFPFIQDNESKSNFGTLRGLHYQLPPFAQSKLVRVISGSVLDVAVDIRRNSATFGKHVAVELSGENKRQLLVPRGFAHGFIVLSESAIFCYKVDNSYSKEHERAISFEDIDLNIDWKVKPENILLSEKDKTAPLFKNADVFEEGNV